MKIVDLSMTVEECDTNPFSPEDVYFKLTPIVRWEDKGFVSNLVEMTVHAGTHIDSPHHFVREKPGVEQIPLEPLIAEALVLDLTFKGTAKARIGPEDLVARSARSRRRASRSAGAMLLLRTDWPKGHDTTDPSWWNDSPCLTKEAAEWLVAKEPSVLGYDFAQEEKGATIRRPTRSSGAACACTARSCRAWCARSRT